MNMTSIIIPNYNGADVLAPCLKSIRHHVHVPHEVIVVDNGSTDDSISICLEHRVRLISLPENRGFPIACNLGLSLAAGDALLLLNSDTVLIHSSLEHMLDCLYSADDIGIVGPVTNYASGLQQLNEPFTRLEDMAVQYAQPDRSKWREVNRLIGFCFLFRREVLEQVGLLDPVYSPGHYEDDDYCYRARQAGYRLMVAGDAFVYHQGSAGFGKQDAAKLSKLIQKNRQTFIQKWGVDPLQYVEDNRLS